MALRSNVIGAAVSGLTAVVLPESQEARLDSACLNYLKVLLGGVAVHVPVVDADGTAHVVVRAPPAIQVWKRAGPVPIPVELRVQRLKEWRKVVRSPGCHAQQLTA
eukprot:3241791-Pyramimonas_sp.AAC.1